MMMGGWDYIGAAYGFSWTVLLLYGLSLFVRHRTAVAEAAAHSAAAKAEV